jgi:hypothetical protein
MRSAVILPSAGSLNKKNGEREANLATRYQIKFEKTEVHTLR